MAAAEANSRDLDPIVVSVDHNVITDSWGEYHDIARQKIDAGQDYEAGRMEKRLGELQVLAGRVLQLPGELVLPVDQTLIFGDNAAGKTTLAHALRIAVRHEYLAKQNPERASDIYEALFVDPDSEDPEVRERISDIENEHHFSREYLYGLAPYFARGLSVDLPEGFDEYSPPISTVYSGSGVVERARMPRVTLSGKVRMVQLDAGSTRQQVDSSTEYLPRFLGSDKLGQTPILEMLDEPEYGLSPWRHENISEEIERICNLYGGVSPFIVIATNSLKLYNERSRYPHLIMDQLDKGIQ